MAQISTYPIISTPTLSDLLIGTDVSDINNTKNFRLSDISDIISQGFVPYVGATGNLNLGVYHVQASSFIVNEGLSSQFLKADGSIDSTIYVSEDRTITINGLTYDLSEDRSWDLPTINSLTTIGTGGSSTYIDKVLNIPVYQPQGNYITQLSGEATGSGPGNASVVLDNTAVISKILSGLNITGGNIVSSDSILQAFGKVQNQINSLVGGVKYKGVWNAATNTPTLLSSVGVQGEYYIVSVAGSTNLNGIIDWNIGDWAIYDGSSWQKVDNTDAVVSVNGYVGAVMLTYSDVDAAPDTRTLTINGVGYNLTADRSWTVGDVRTDSFYADPTWITSLNWSKIINTPTTLSGYGITDAVNQSRELTINGVTYDLSQDRLWDVGTITSIATSGPITGGTITDSGTIGITQAGILQDGYLSSIDWNTFNDKQDQLIPIAPITLIGSEIGITQAGVSSNGYLSSTDWNTFNNKQDALINPVTGSGTTYSLPMWSGPTSLMDSPLSYVSDTFTFNYDSIDGASVVFLNSGTTAYAYTITMNNYGSPRMTSHSYTDGDIAEFIGSTQIRKTFATGNTLFGTSVIDLEHKLSVQGDLYVQTIPNATIDTNKFLVDDAGVIKYRTGSEMLSDIGAVSSIGLTMPAAFSVANSPITSAGTLEVTANGTSSQYIRGDGQLATFPSTGAGGSSVYYYLNGSINSTVVGYKQMSNTAVIGTGTDFDLVGNGLIAEFLTDIDNPNRLEIPGGAWNLEMFFNISSVGGNAKFYVELLKYDGTTFTSIASSATNPEEITGGTAIDLYLTSVAVPQTTLLTTDRLAIRVYIVDNSGGRTVTLHTEDNTLCQITTTFAGGISALNGLTTNTQYFAVGTFGTDFEVSSLLDTHTFNLPTASSANRGALSSTDWTLFNSKQNAISLTTIGSSGPSTLISDILNVPNYTLSGLGGVPTSRTLSINGISFDLSVNRSWSVGTVTSVAELTLGTAGTDLSSSVANGTTTPVITLNVPTASAANRGALSAADWSTFNTKVGSVTTSSPLFSSGGQNPNITIQQASGSQSGFLSSTDWSTFNNKQAAGNYITSLTGEATATGPGAAAVTLNNASVTGKVLTGVNITGGTVLATDTMLTAFGKLQNQINGLFGGAIYQGTWNASTNTPALTSSVGTKGYYYIVSVAGTTNLNGITDWFVGDWAIFDGTAWQQVDNTDAVVSVNGQTGAVSLTTDNISEGVTNLYFTQARSRSSLTFAAGSGAYNSTTGLITIPTNTNQLTNGASYITLASLSGVAPIQYNNGTGAISITQAGTASNGFLSSTDWNTFNNKAPSVAGGYLPLSGGTLTGTLNGTNAGFTRNVNSSTTPILLLKEGDIATPYAQISGLDYNHGIIFRGVPSNNTDYEVTAGNQMSFYEYGGDFRFYKKQPSGLVLQASIIDGAATFNSTNLNSIYVSNPTTSGLATGSGIGFGAYNGTLISQSAGIILTSNTWSYGTYSANQLSINSDGGGGLALRSANSAPITFFTGGTTAGLSTLKMTLTSSGDLGVGVTPSAWDTSVYKAIELNNGVALASYVAGAAPILWLGANVYYSGANNIYKINAAATLYVQNQGTHIWSVAPSGTAGNTITFTQAMTLSGGGNLGIGVIAPLAKLHVEGPTISYGQVRISNTDAAGEATINIGRTNQPLDERWTFGQGPAGINNSFGFYTNGLVRFQLATSGASTFSSTLKIGGTLYLPNSIAGRTSQIEFGNLSSGDLLGMPNESSTFYLSYGTNNINFRNDNFGEILRLSNNGASTFNSSAFNVATFNSTYGQMAISLANSNTIFGQIGSGNSVTPSATSDDLGLGTSGLNKSIVFATGTGYLERMRIASGGNVGIGITTPVTMLHILYPNQIPKEVVQGIIRLTGQSNTEYGGTQLSGGTSLEFYNKWSNGAEYSVGRISGRASQGYAGGLQFDVAPPQSPGQSNYITALSILNNAAATFSSSLGVGGFGAVYSSLESSSSTFNSTVGLLSLAIKDGTYNPRAIISFKTQVGSAYSVIFDSSYSSGWGQTNWSFISGNVGIGELTPISKLHVNGTVRTVLTSGVGGQTLISAINGVSNGYLINVDTSNNITHNWHTGTNASAMYITAGGSIQMGRTGADGEKLGVLISNSSSIASVPAVARFMNSGTYNITKLILTDNTVSDATICFSPMGSGGSVLSFGVQGTTVNYQTLNVHERGNVGVGNSNPLYKLDVSGEGRFFSPNINDTAPTLMLSNGGAYATIAGAGDMYHGLVLRGKPSNTTNYAVTAGDEMSFYEYGGVFNFYKKQPSVLSRQVYFDNGSVYASAFFEISDSRLKNLIKDDYKVIGIESIKPKLYIKNGKEEVGYFAQDFQNLLPTAVNIDDKGMLSLSYTQVHTAKIAIIEDKVTILEREVSELKVKLQKYKA